MLILQRYTRDNNRDKIERKIKQYLRKVTKISTYITQKMIFCHQYVATNRLVILISLKYTTFHCSLLGVQTPQDS